MGQIARYFHTVRYLKFKQVLYQVIFRLKKKCRSDKPVKHSPGKPVTGYLALDPGIEPDLTFRESTFTFLSLEYHFEKNVNWEYSGFGRLWTYNLNYFDFLNQPEINTDQAVNLVKDFIQQLRTRSTGMEPYPISLRGVNWVKFISKLRIEDPVITGSLYHQYRHLYHNPEFHIMGNHLLENGFSLLYGALFFRDDQFLKKAETILVRELNEQILDDGAHFELTPMYHQVILHRLLDGINLLKNNQPDKQALLDLFQQKAALMLGWLHQITWKNGELPLVNDTAPGIAPATEKLVKYAHSLGIEFNLNQKLGPSGYRKFTTGNFEILIDAGQIGPSYILGHAHADALNFLVMIRQQPFITDTGISTYQNDEVRHRERSTGAHNTVIYKGLNQSDVWGSHRAGRRARSVILHEPENGLSAVHDGYRDFGVTHERTFRLPGEKIEIDDFLYGRGQPEGNALIHLAPGITVRTEGQTVLTPFAKITFENPVSVDISSYEFAETFNRRREAPLISVRFIHHLKTIIEL